MVTVYKDEGEGMHDAHLVDLGAQGIETFVEDGCNLLIEVIFLAVDPLLHDTAVHLLVIIIVCKEISRLLSHLKVNVGEYCIPVSGILGNDLANGTINLLDGLLSCVHRPLPQPLPHNWEGSAIRIGAGAPMISVSVEFQQHRLG